VNYRASHLLSYFCETYGFKVGDFPIAEGIGDATISLPFYPNMPLEDVDRVIEVLREVLV
jgi:UDP-4-amino-4-deoxy-L-arabinose-oxoglutarate aminotransferase